MLRSILMLCFMSLQVFVMALPPTDLSGIGVIPKPVSVNSATGTFTLTEKSTIFVTDESAEIMKIGLYLAAKINPAEVLRYE